MPARRRGDVLPTQDELTVEALRRFIQEELERHFHRLERSIRRMRRHRTWFVDPDAPSDELEDALQYDPDEEEED